MRGVVSLAAALSIPVLIDDGSAFPQRELILFISFTVIILTLFVQGLTLPYILGKMGGNNFVEVEKSEEKAVRDLRKEMWKHAIDYLENNKDNEFQNSEYITKWLDNWRKKSDNTEKEAMIPEAKTTYLKVLQEQRNFLVEKNKNPETDEEIIRKQIYLIDLEEERIKAI